MSSFLCKQNAGNTHGYYLIILIIASFLMSECTTKLYTRKQLEEHTTINCPEEFQEIIRPLVTDLSVILKELYFLKAERAELKERLWDGGTNQRILRIDDNLTSINKEILRLNQIRAEILDLVYQIVSDFTEPVVIGYLGERKRYKKITTPIILVSFEEQQYHRRMKENGEKIFSDYSYKATIKNAQVKYEELTKTKCPVSITPIGTKGPIKKIKRKEEPTKRPFSIEY